ncbi:MAG: RHS repeat-associated core domain-containing protein [Rhodoglobus sp.]
MRLTHARKNAPHTTTAFPVRYSGRARRTAIVGVVVAAVGLGSISAIPAVAAPEVRHAAPAPTGTVPGTDTEAPVTPVSEPVDVAPIESWTPSTHSVTDDGETTLDVFAQPAFKRVAAGWTPISSTITAGTGQFPFEALGLANPVHFGTTAEALLTLDTASGSVAFGLAGANVTTPTLHKGVITYADVFAGVDLEFRTNGDRVGKHLVLADENAQQAFTFTINDATHSLGDPTEGAGEAWSFESSIAFGTGLELPSPVAWAQTAEIAVGLPGSAHQDVSVNAGGYSILLTVDPLWVESATFPVVLDPAVQWTDETWHDDDGLDVAFGPIGNTVCDGGPCQLADPLEGQVAIGDLGDGRGEYLTYVGTDVGALADRQISSAVLAGYDYMSAPTVVPLCSVVGPTSTGVDLASARCGKTRIANAGWHGSANYWWSTDVTDTVRAAAKSNGETGTIVGFAVGSDGRSPWYRDLTIYAPFLRLVYMGYPVPRPLTKGQTFGCTCWAGGSPGNQATAGDPVNTATGALIEQLTDLSVAGIGESIALSRAYNSLDTTTGPFGPGWAGSFGASLIANADGDLVFRDGSGTQTRFGALVGGGYAPLDPAVSAGLTDGPDGTHVMRNLTGATMTFDAAGVLLASADASGQGLTFTYSAGQLTTVTDALAQSVTLGWDGDTGAEARITSATTSDGRTVAYTYTSTAGAKRLTAVTGVDGAISTYAYATNTGGLSRITDPLGHVSARNTYDRTSGRITSQLDQTGAKTTFAWDPGTQTATITDPTGTVRQDVYNDLNLVKQIDGNGAVTQTLYDGDNNASATVDAADRLYRTEYDDQDRLILRVAPAPLYYAETWTYDDANNVTSYTNPDLNTTTYDYNSAGLVTGQHNPDATTTTVTYTSGADGQPANLPATSTDAIGRTTTFSYDAVGNLVSTSSPSGKVTSSTYDAAHQVTSTTTASGEVTSFTYDVAGRMLTSTDPLGAVTTNIYDGAGRLTRTLDPLGRTTIYSYDAANRLTQTRSGSGQITKTSYDGTGRVATTTDPAGAVTTYGYDNAGRPVTTTDPLGHTTTTAYDNLGQVASVSDPTGAKTSYDYDVIGRQTTATDPDGVTQTTTYDRTGQVASVANATGGAQQSSYDVMGRLEYTVDSDGVSTSNSYNGAGELTSVTKDRSTSDYVPDYYTDATTYTYDEDGNRTTTTDPRGNVPGAAPAAFTTTVAYDADARPVTVTDPLGQVTSTTYDAVGNPLTVTDALGRTTTSTYDSGGRTTSVTSATGAKTRYVYTKNDDLARLIDPSGHATTYTYDGAGRPLTKTDPLGRVTASTYDVAGNLTTAVKPSGTATAGDRTDGTVSYARDAANRVTAITYSDTTPALTYTYSPAGRVQVAARVQDAETVASTTTAYDDAGRPTSTTSTGPGASTANYSYTSAGRLAGAAWSTGQSAAYSYNSTGELTTIDPTGVGTVPAVNYTYDPTGRATAVTRGTGADATTSTSTYDNAGQLSRLEHQSASGVLAAYTIARDGAGNPTQVDTTQAVTGSPGTMTSATAQYTYDGVNRITRQCYPSDGATCKGNSPRTSYTYDRTGNRTKQADTTIAGKVATTTSTVYAYDSGDQLLIETVAGSATVTNTWTSDGAEASTTTSDGTRTFTTNLAGELTGVALENADIIGYTYDGQRNRTSRTNNNEPDTTWTWDSSTGLTVRTGEYASTGALTNAWLPDPTSTTGAALASTTASGNSDWLLADPFANTTTAASTTTATVAGVRSLDAFGQATKPATGELASQPLGFAGQYLDSRTGLYDMRARDYNPTTGQFLTIDPLIDQTRQPYQYGNNNPLVFIDPTGLVACGPMDSGDCNGRNLLPRLDNMSRSYDDAGYLALYDSLTRDQRAEIGYDAMGLINNEAVNRLQHLQVCSVQGGCLPPCPDEGYTACQLARGSRVLADFAAWQALGLAVPALLSRACAADTAAAAAAAKTAASAADEWANVSGILRDASRGKGNFGIGTGTAAEALKAGRAWVGDGARLASDGKTWLSQDGLRQWRPPSFKPGWQGGTWQSNFESRWVPSGQWQTNVHLDITELP